MMCPRCKSIIDDSNRVCDSCGYILSNYIDASREKKMMIKYIFLGVIIGLVIVLLVFFAFLSINKILDKYYFDNTAYNTSSNVVKNLGTTMTGKYTTAIIADNTYSGVRVKNKEDADNLIINDSITQKGNCPTEILDVENQMINRYNITAVNLCEMDPNFAMELSNVLDRVYNDFPNVRGYMTNLTLINAKVSDNYIAAFMPVFNFATSSTRSTYPWVIKTQLLLNTTYFLNRERLEATVFDSVSANHFPKNATIYSPIAHELGHYLSFLALMKSYKLDSILLVDSKNINKFYDVYDDFAENKYSYTLIEEAYNKYIKDTNSTINIDEFRGMISSYALAKDNTGDYIYDETIAEAFHDVYLNGDNATIASKYIMQVLKNKLEG